MPYRTLSATLTDADVQAIKAAVTTIHSKMPFLISLTPDERRKLFKMGSKSQGFVGDCLIAARNSPEILPARFQVADFAQDVALAESLGDVLSVLRQIVSQVDDTHMAVASQANVQAADVYGFAKSAVKSTPGMKTVVMQLSERFQKTPPARRSEPEAAAPKAVVSGNPLELTAEAA